MSRPKWLNLPEMRRWATLRCEHCGHRFRWKRDYRHSFGNRDGKVYHRWCMSYIEWHRIADERLRILAVTADLAGLTKRDVTIAHEKPSPCSRACCWTPLGHSTVATTCTCHPEETR